MEDFWPPLCDKREGGEVAHRIPKDSGGLTFCGISMGAHPGWSYWPQIEAARKVAGRLVDRNLSARARESAGHLAYLHYFVPSGADVIADRDLAEHVCDFAFHSGVKPAVATLQTVVNSLREGDADDLAMDGIAGSRTKAATSETVARLLNKGTQVELPCIELATMRYEILRRHYMEDVAVARDWLEILPGWLKRLRRI